MRPTGSDNPDHRLPTLLYTDERTGTPMNSNIPLHPQPGIFETTVALTSAGVVDHVEVERVMARPPWDFEEANYRLHREAMERRNEEFRAALAAEEKARAAAAKRPAKKAPARSQSTTKKTTAKKAPAKKAAPKPSTRKRSN